MRRVGSYIVRVEVGSPPDFLDACTRKPPSRSIRDSKGQGCAGTEKDVTETGG